MELKGKYNQAKVFTDNIDSGTIGQVIELCNQEVFEHSQIRIMPDCHQGKGCVIGTTMTVEQKIVPNLVGVDIGCGVTGLVIPKDKWNIDLSDLDNAIRRCVPHGFRIHNESKFGEDSLNEVGISLTDLYADVDLDRAYKSLGTLGGGNHYIEVDEFKNGDKLLVVHSGSRHMGLEVAMYHQKQAIKYCTNKYEMLKKERIAAEKCCSNPLDMEDKVKEINAMYRKPKDELCYLEGVAKDKYLHDMDIAQRYAQANRIMILNNILGEFWTASETIQNTKTIIESIHNYVDLKHMILRKGSISACKGEQVIIPINMRDGAIIGVGKGNEDWNYSAPHGAGRILSRREAKEQISIDEFKDSMKDVYSTSVNGSTLDESPQAYKPIEEIVNNIGDTVDIVEIVKPIYNFKSN